MKFEFVETPVFARELKRLAKKYRSLKQDILSLKTNIEENPELGVDLGEGFRKIRLNFKGKREEWRGQSNNKRYFNKYSSS